MNNQEFQLVKHPTLELWGTEESLKEYERHCKILMDQWELDFWWNGFRPKTEVPNEQVIS